MNLDETIIMIRAICSSEKDPTPLRQLSSKLHFFNKNNNKLTILI